MTVAAASLLVGAEEGLTGASSSEKEEEGLRWRGKELVEIARCWLHYLANSYAGHKGKQK